MNDSNALPVRPRAACITATIRIATVLGVLTLGGAALLPQRGVADVALPAVDHGRLVRLNDVTSAQVPARPVDVWLPDHYDGKTPHAVLYMHDGQMLFDNATTWNGQSWRVAETAQRLHDSGAVRPFIVVGVHNAGAARHSEYFPQKPFESLSESERARLYRMARSPGVPLFAKPVYSDAYLRFLVEELKPRIDAAFATDPGADATFVAGSSMGGLISWYAVTEYPETFGGAAALSTHWPGTFESDGNPLPRAFLRYLAQALPEPGRHRFYFDHGDQTLDAAYPPLQAQVDRLFGDLGFSAPWWRSAFFPGAAHTETAWAERLSIPLTFLLQPRDGAAAR
jgi:enterochelin esterase-like enzyme